MADALIEAKKAVLADAERRIAELQVLAKSLRQDLGMAVDAASAAESGQSQNHVPLSSLVSAGSVNVNELVTPGDFLGMTQVDAIQTFLQRVGKGRPVTLQEIAAALFRGKATDALLEGLKLKNLSSVLSRNEVFLSVARGRWSLAEFYPKSVVEARRKAAARATTNGDIPSDEEVEAVVQAVK
jgi:hypothetical protein